MGILFFTRHVCLNKKLLEIRGKSKLLNQKKDEWLFYSCFFFVLTEDGVLLAVLEEAKCDRAAAEEYGVGGGFSHGSEVLRKWRIETFGPLENKNKTIKKSIVQRVL